jgi:outer membrane protein TolC
MNLKIGAVAVIITAISFSAVSAETYTLDKCIKTALENNYSIVAAKNSYDVSKTFVVSSYAEFLPSISISTRANRSWSGRGGYDITADRFYAGKSDSYSGTISFSQTYPGFGLYQLANICKSKNDRGSALNGYISAQNDLVLNVKNNYYNLLKAKMLHDVAIDAVKRGEERLRVVQSKYDLGSASMSDVLKAKVQVGNDRLDLISRRNTFNLAKAQLSYSMGVDVNTEFEVDENLPERTIDISFEDALTEALSNNPDYKKAQFELGAAKASRTLAYTSFLPALTLGLSHSTNVDEFSRLTDFKSLDAGYTIYGVLSFNIFNNVSDYANLKAAKRNVNTHEEGLKNSKNSMALALKQSFLDLERAAEAKKLAGESVAAAQEDLNLVREKYNLGAATILEVLDAEVSFKQSQTSNVEVIYDYNLAVSNLEKALGR